MARCISKFVFGVKSWSFYFVAMLLGYKFVQAIDENLKMCAYRLRFEVYAEREYLDPKDYKDGLFSDQYDQYAISFLAIKNNKPVGTIRLIPRNGQLPTEKLFNLSDQFKTFINSESKHFLELSRLVIAPEFRRKSKIHGRTAMFGLAFVSLRYSLRHHFRYWIMNLPEYLAGTFSQLSANLEKIPELPPTTDNIAARKTIAGYFGKHTLFPYFLDLQSVPNLKGDKILKLHDIKS